MIFLLQVQKREIFSMTPGKHIVPNEVELKCFLFSGLTLNTIRKIHIIKFTGEKSFFCNKSLQIRVRKYTLSQYQS